MARIEPFNVSNELLDQPEKLQEQARQDGYLFFRGLIDADAIYNLRQDFLGICHRHGWAQGGEALMDGIRTGGPYMEGDDGYWPVLDEFQSLESFHAFAHHPAILDVCDKLCGEKTLVHPRNIGRIMFPENTKYTTPAHQDFIHIRGTEETYTGWIPLGACPKDMGGLTILSGSHRGGIYPVKPAFGAGGLGIDTEPMEADGLYWVAGDLKLATRFSFTAMPFTRDCRTRVLIGFAFRWITAIKDAQSRSRKGRFYRISIGCGGTKFIPIGNRRSTSTIGTLST